MGSGNYFRKEHEEKIVEYNNAENQAEKNRIYRDHLDKPISKLCEIIVNMGDFHINVDKQDFIDRVKAHVVSTLDMYDQSKGKAYSYFSFVAKNKALALSKKNYDNNTKHTSIDNEDVNTSLPTRPQPEVQSEHDEFLDLYIKYWEEQMFKEFSKKRDLRVADAILDIFKKRKSIDSFKKRILYTMIRDASGVKKAQHITKVVKSFKNHYFKSYQRYLETGSIEPKRMSVI